MANHIGVTFQQLQKYESGANRISIGRLTRIAKALKVDVMYLLDGGRKTAPLSSRQERAKVADGIRMLGRINALRLLTALLAIPPKPPSLRESIVEMVEKTAEASGKEVVRQRKDDDARTTRLVGLVSAMIVY